MLRNALCLLLALTITFVCCSLATSPTNNAVETIEGDVRKVERFDSSGQHHGLQEVWFKGVLVQEREAEHGQIIKRVEYNPDGSLKEKWVEGDDYQLIQVYP